MTRINILKQDKGINITYIGLLLTTIIVGTWPFLIFAHARRTGELPSQQAWELLNEGYNYHGPWYWTTKADNLLCLMGLSLGIVPVTIALVIGMACCPQFRRWLNVTKGVLLVLLQLAFVCAQMRYLLWVYD